MADETVAWAPGSTDPKVAFAEFKLHLRTITPRLYVVPAVVTLNVLVFAIMVATGVSALNPSIEQAVRWGADYGPLTLGRLPWRLVTNLFVHFGAIHLAANVAALLSSGPTVERLFGAPAFAALYLTAGLSGSLASVAIHPLTVSAGASGAIFGVYGALGALLLLQRDVIPRIVLSKLGGVAGGFIIYNLIYGFGHTGIDNIAHLGGLVGGAAVGVILHGPLHPGRPASRGRPAMVLAGAVGLALGAAIALPRPISFESILWNFGADQKAALARYDLAVKQLNRREIGPQDAANRIEYGVLPPWRKARAALEGDTNQLLARPPGVSAEAQRALQLFDQSAVAYEEGWTKMVQVLRAGDLKKTATAAQEMYARIEQTSREMAQLTSD